MKILYFIIAIFVQLPAFADQEEAFFDQAIERQSYEKILTCSERILALGDNLGLTRQELFDMVLYIETELAGALHDGEYYRRKEHTGLARTIEFDPVSQRVFIHLKNHGIRALGKGRYKKVTCSIMYDAENPELVANCSLIDDGSSSSKKSIEREIATIRKVQREPGIAWTYAITEHRKKESGLQVVSFIQKLYRSGSLKNYLRGEERISEQDMVSLAHDFIQGLEVLHKNDLIHGDLHAGNMLLDKRSDLQERLRGCIVDFGHTNGSLLALSKAPRIEASSRCNPPEAFSSDVLQLDAKAIDIYALGLSLYHLYFGQQAEWAFKETFSQISHMNQEEKEQFRLRLRGELEKYRELRLEQLKNDGSVGDEFVKVILQMIDPDPQKRGTAHAIGERLEAITIPLESQTIFFLVLCITNFSDNF